MANGINSTIETPFPPAEHLVSYASWQHFKKKRQFHGDCLG